VLSSGEAVEESALKDPLRNLLRACQDTRDSSIQLNAPVFDPAAGVSTPTLSANHSAKLDKAMEVWAQAQCGEIKVSTCSIVAYRMKSSHFMFQYYDAAEE